ncbi:STAS domain-containing protein [Bacillus sp. FJAT-45037]|uniref:STAS domain-containing protein n=1 Tax=Bacillus sp. FJAT-45037 TaxID=2011007 RepID=UPI000C23E640|nr:STAS domain-containing protein [Bacillus sp. FJAT-45037]
MSLYKFFKENTWNLTEQWYDELDKTQEGVYSSTVEVIIQRLKDQNHQFHVNFAELFNDEETDAMARFNSWLDEIAQDQSHLDSRLDQIIGEFMNVQELYYQLIQQYVAYNNHEATHTQVYAWNRVITSSFKTIIQEFSKRHMEESERLLKSQQEMITELSSPIIRINQHIAILPLIGDIDTYRARVIFDQALNECNTLGVEHLVIDLSGVPIIDTMVANQIFQVVSGLELIGTNVGLSGIRPEIAQTAIQLGINFKHLKTYSSLAQALSKIMGSKQSM